MRFRREAAPEVMVVLLITEANFYEPKLSFNTI